PAERYAPPEKKDSSPSAWVRDPDRLLAARDKVRIEIPSQPGLTRDTKIGPDGTLSFPHVGSMLVAGLTAGKFRNRLASALSAHIRSPVVRVLVRKRVRGRADMVGKVRSGRKVEFHLPPWLSGVIGPGRCTRHANLAQILVVRPAEKKVIVCNMYAHAVDQDRKQDILVVDGDVIVITELYPMEVESCAREWGPIADFLAGRIDRAGLVSAIRERPPPPWPRVRNR
ncbi:MAG: polysaccharide biosynthesis/export family protein, partial [Planctomycetota bacterium]